MSLKFNLASFLFPRSVARQNNGVTNTLNDITKDEVGALEGTITNNQTAAATLGNNNVDVKGLMESYEEGLAGMQDVVADIREIICSIDNVLQEFEAIDYKRE
jgi:ABC-type transporter Mla subunit MlaD